MRSMKLLSAASVLAASALVLTGCAAAEETPAGSGLTGTVTIDGSSTVAPLMEAGADLYGAVEPGVDVTVGTSGTGGGFEKFCAGETDISNASRGIKDEEAAACAEAGIEFTEILIANDGLSVVVNPENDWATCLTVEQLNKIWAPESEGAVMSWKDVDASFPDEKLSLFGPGTDSGTFDYFTKEINGEEGASRTDYSPSEDDNVLVSGVSAEKGGLGYFGLSYAEANADVVKLVPVDSGAGCVTPSTETVLDGTYTPLSRPLFIYVSNTAYAENAAVASFVDFLVANETEAASASGFIGLSADQLAVANEELASLKK
ncbi:MAG: PstS family phosphate ABC transporter substrate-binding protein [Actinobacteria bacterium]|nr:PstS family phosphate ABC transporter substrate-binding protein [Actinomycetota bacterium]